MNEERAQRPIEEVLRDVTPQLLQIAGVAGTYESLTEDGKPCIKVAIVADTPEIRKRIPESIEGYPVVLRVTGDIEPK